MSGFRSGLKDSLLIAAGYIPIAFAFGVAAVQSGLSPSLSLLVSAVVFAGGSQFVLISLMSGGGPLWIVVSTVLLMNARHLLYGRQVSRLLGRAGSLRASLWFAFGLTDEVFATAMGKLASISVPQRSAWYSGLQLGAYLSWVGGTLLGCAAGSEVLSRFPTLNAGFSFVLPAFFFSLLLDMKPAVARLPALSGVLLTLGLSTFASAPVAIPLGLLGGAIVAALLRGMMHGH